MARPRKNSRTPGFSESLAPPLRMPAPATPIPTAWEEPRDLPNYFPTFPPMEKARILGLLEGETRHVNVRVPARLLEAAMKVAGGKTITDVLVEALAHEATRSRLGEALLENWGSLADIDPELAAEIDAL